MILFIGVCVLSCFSHVQLFATPWTAACQTSLSMEFSRQEYWSGLPCLPPADLPHPGIKPTSLKSPALAGRSLPLATPGKPDSFHKYFIYLLRIHCDFLRNFHERRLPQSILGMPKHSLNISATSKPWLIKLLSKYYPLSHK